MIGPEGFDRRYAEDPDPFDVAGSWYERRKQAVLIASLARPRYALVWDAASGTGHLVRALLEQGRAERVLATDASAVAVGLSAALLGGHDAASTGHSALPAVPQAARVADLTVVAEVLYYLSEEDRVRTYEGLTRQHGEMVSVHWRHHPHDARLSGAAVTEELGESLEGRGWTRHCRHDDADFVLMGWVEPRA